MKLLPLKVFSFSISLCLLSLLPISESQALFGFSKCEKIKKEIVIKEKNISNYIAYLRTNVGSHIVIYSKKGIRIFEASQSERKEIYEVWKIATNNPKCFTNTQQMAISDESKWLKKSYVVITPLVGKWVIYEENSFLSLYSL